MARLDDLSWDLINEDSLFPGLQGFQGSHLGYATELLILYRETVEFFTNGACERSVFYVFVSRCTSSYPITDLLGIVFRTYGSHLLPCSLRLASRFCDS